MVPRREPPTDPPYQFECLQCGARTTEDHQPVRCPECGGELENLARSRE